MSSPLYAIVNDELQHYFLWIVHTEAHVLTEQLLPLLSGSCHYLSVSLNTLFQGGTVGTLVRDDALLTNIVGMIQRCPA
jgi:hypothetical protein